MKRREIRLLKEIKDYIDTNNQKEILVKDICTMFGINRNKLQSGFKFIFNQTIHAYIIHSKLTKASEMLLSTDYSIKSVTLEFGYSPSNFDSKFKKKFGCSPEQYREREEGSNGK